MSEPYRSKVYTERPSYADYDSPEKFQAILGIIMTHLSKHPNACCSYSGGADSDIMIDLLETARQMIPSLPAIDYYFFNTGLEMKAIRDHVKDTEKKYGVEIKTVRPKKNVVIATREYGVPFVSKIMATGLGEWQKKNVPLSVADEYNEAEDKEKKFAELVERYPGCKSVLTFICCCSKTGEPRPDIQLVINSSQYMLDFIRECPPDFKISAKCCDYCKKAVAHEAQKGYEMIITGERRDEGGMRSVPRGGDLNSQMCFTETSSGQFRFRPLYYVSDKDKAWYKQRFNIRYSDAYEVYGLVRTGCTGCPISYRAVDDLEKIGKYEPKIVEAAWSVFGDSYRYRQKYNEYKKRRRYEDKCKRENVPGQMSLFDTK